MASQYVHEFGRVSALAGLAVLLFSVTPASAAAAAADDAGGAVSFRRDVAPILLDRCQGCHGGSKSKGGYRVDTFDRLMAPGASGAPSVTPRDVARSELYRLLVTPDEDDRMPKDGEPLAPAEVERVKRWIEAGAEFDGGPDRAVPLASLVADQPHPSAPAAYVRPVPVVALAFSPDGKTLAAGGYHEVTLWDAASGELRARLGNLPQRIHALDFSPDGTRLAVAGGTPGSSGEVRVVDPAGVAAPHVLERIADLVLAVRFSPDGTRLAAGGADNVVRLYDVTAGKLERAVEHHADWVLDVAFSPDGRWLASSSRDKSARVIDAATGEQRGAFLDHADAVSGVAWSPDGERCFSAGRDRRLYAWDPDENENPESKRREDWEPPALPADPLRVTAAADAVLVACADGVVRAYRRQSPPGTPPVEFGRFDDWAHGVAAHAPSARVAAASHGGEVRVWSITDGKQLLSFIAAPGYQRPATP